MFISTATSTDEAARAATVSHHIERYDYTRHAPIIVAPTVTTSG